MNRTELLKISKPILFNTDMVKAILDGRKTVARRVVNPQIETFGKAFAYKGALCSMDWVTEQSQYKIGDILYVRETWVKIDNEIMYKADDEIPEGWHLTAWKPSIHMPKSAARIFLKVTDVRVEKVHDITREQAIKEGFNSENEFMREFFKTYPKQHLDWLFNDEDLWVWVCEFEREENNG